MTTPDTTTEQDELTDQLLNALGEALDGVDLELTDNPDAYLLEAVAEPLAAIRRQAAADALNEQARRITKTASFYEQQARSGAAKGLQLNSDTYALRASQAHGDAGMLRSAARDVIAEGYAYTCPWTAPANRENPGDYCENRVEHEGDHCPQHETEDDDRWAE